MERRTTRAAADRRARELRLQLSQSEWRLWQHLRGRQLNGHKFRRQYPIGPYFADFACLDRRLVVEVDGDEHGSRQAYDRHRDALLTAEGWRVLRFWVNELDQSLSAALEVIAEALAPPT